jgi:type IV secretory pathway VirB10-like protein
MLRVSRIARMTIALSTLVVLGGTAVAASAIAAELALPGSFGTSTLTSSPDRSSSGPALSATATTPSAPSLPSTPSLPPAPTLQDPPQAPLTPTLPNTPQTPALPAVRQDQPVVAQGSPQTESRAPAPTGAARSAPHGRRPGDRAAAGRRAPRQTGARAKGSQAAAGGGHRAQPGRNRDSSRDNDTRTAAGRPIALGDPAHQGLALSRFDRLGASPEYPSPSRLLSSFGDDSTAGFVWALQLLAVMLLIALGGFLRIARPL